MLREAFALSAMGTSNPLWTNNLLALTRPPPSIPRSIMPTGCPAERGFVYTRLGYYFFAREHPIDAGPSLEACLIDSERTALHHYLGVFIYTLFLSFCARPVSASDLITNRFRNLSIDDGLSQVMVTALIQDARGFIWVGTKAGLNRYDGYDFHVYESGIDSPHALLDGYITALVEDGARRIWIGTREGGLSVFDPRAQTFRAFTGRDHSAGHLPDDEVTALAWGPDGSIWVGTPSGLFRLDPSTERFERIALPITDSEIARDHPDRVNHISRGAGGRLWVMTQSGVFDLDPHDPADEVRFWPTAVDNPTAPAGRAVHMDDGSVWVSTMRGLFMRSLDDDRFRRAHADSRFAKACLGLARLGDLLWMTVGWDIVVLDPRDGRYQVLEADDGRHALPSTVINDALVDRSGLYWLGTNIGLAIYDPTRSFYALSRRDGLEAESVYALAEDESGRIWIGSEPGGLYVFDRESGRLAPVVLEGLSRDTVTDLFPTDGGIWIGFRSGATYLDFDTGSHRSWSHGPEGEGLPDRVVSDILDDGQGRIWVTTEGGLCLIDPETRRTRHFVAEAGRADALQDDDLRVLFLGQEGEGIWIGSEGGGLIRFDPAIETFRHLHPSPGRPSHSRVICITETGTGSSRRLWLGTRGGGFARFDPQTGSFRDYRDRDGLPDNTVYGILEDEAGMLWLSTNIGIARFDPVGETFKRFDRNDGLGTREFNTGAYLRARDGTLFFGGINGVAWFRSDEIDTACLPPGVVLTDFLLANKPAPIGTESPIDRHISFTEGIRLGHEENVFSLRFAALDFGAPERNTYRYKLDGFDSAWIDTDAANRVATYTNLDPGDYVFRVEAANRDGVWNHEGVALAVTVEASPWRTPFAYGCYVLGVICLVWSFLRLEKRALRKANRHLEAEVSERTLQLDARVRELEILGEIANAINRDIELPKVVDTLLEKGLALFPSAERAAFLLPETESFFRIFRTRGFPAESLGERVDLRRADEIYEVAQCRVEDQVFFYSGLREGRFENGQSFLPARSAIAVHILRGERKIGLLVLSHTENDRAFADSDLTKLVRFRDFVVSAVAKALIFKELLDAQEALMASAHQAGMSEVATQVLHNLGNALTRIRTSIDLIHETVADEKARRLFARIIDKPLIEALDGHDDPERCGVLIEAMQRIARDWARAHQKLREESTFAQDRLREVTRLLWQQLEYTSGETMIDLIHLEDVVEEAIGLEIELLEHKGIQVIRRIDEAPPIYLDRGKLRQVLLSLMENAREAIVERDSLEHGRLEFRLSHLDDEISLTICDNGVGISSEISQKIFFQGFSTKDDRRGLGLHTSVLAVESMGGTLSVSSPGSDLGTTVSIRFPLVQSVSARA